MHSCGIIVLINLLGADSGNRIIKESLCSASVQGSALLYFQRDVLWILYKVIRCTDGERGVLGCSRVAEKTSKLKIALLTVNEWQRCVSMA